MFKIITISRECGSGGHSIAEALSKTLGIPCYDKEIISMVAEKCNVTEDYAKEASELLKSGIFHGLIGVSNLNYPYATPSLQDQINSVQIDIIKDLAEKGPCIIVGRGADFILRDNDDVLNVFIKASMDYKVSQALKKHNLTDADAKNILKKRDKERSKHYYFYTGQNWGEAKNYDIVLDSGKLGEEKCVDIIANIFNN